jgi:septum formation protein
MIGPNPDFILASASPRRCELLQQIGCRFQVSPVDIDETVLVDESPAGYVERMSLQKAQAGWDAHQIKGLPVLGADTAVVLDSKGSGGKGVSEIFGKPLDQAHAISMLMRLSGATHRVLSGVAIVKGHEQQTILSESLVTFRNLTEEECARYWLTGEPNDKAGAYAIQGLGAVFVEYLSGSYSGVVGLPIIETCKLLGDFDISWWTGIKK